MRYAGLHAATVLNTDNDFLIFAGFGVLCVHDPHPGEASIHGAEHQAALCVLLIAPSRAFLQKA